MDERTLAVYGRPHETRFGTSVSDGFDAVMAAAGGPEEAERAVVAIITDTVSETQRDLVLSHELYTLAARKPAFRAITNSWTARSRAALERHFDPATASMLDALIEGLTIRRALDSEPQDPAVAAEAVRRIFHDP